MGVLLSVKRLVKFLGESKFQEIQVLFFSLPQRV